MCKSVSVDVQQCTEKKCNFKFTNLKMQRNCNCMDDNLKVLVYMYVSKGDCVNIHTSKVLVDNII